jgi:2-methylcitrate dehydratase PrpD
VNFGTQTKPLHSGWAARSGLDAANLAAAGFTASNEALAAEGRGFLSVYGTAETEPAALERLGAPYTLADPGVAFKKYACCFALHRAIEAVHRLRQGNGLVASHVNSITALVPPGALGPLPYSRPSTGLEAKFSMEHVLAIGLVDDVQEPGGALSPQAS